MELSVVIPTYNRANTLRECLEYLQKQSTRDFEVIVIDDGSTDETKKVVTNFVKDSWLDLHYFYQKNQKQATARNLGIQKAQGNIILFLGDDIFALPSLVENHLAVHNTFPENNIAVLGYTTWAPFLEVNDYMKFLEWSGWQFHYEKIKRISAFKNFSAYKEHHFKGKFLPTKSQHWFFYTSNLSLKKELLLAESFDEKFKAYGWEDIELGLRLSKKQDLHLFYNPDAEAYHAHLQYEKEFENKVKNLANSLKLVPELKPKLWQIYVGKIFFNHFFIKICSLCGGKKWELQAKGKQIFYNNL